MAHQLTQLEQLILQTIDEGALSIKELLPSKPNRPTPGIKKAKELKHYDVFTIRHTVQQLTTRNLLCMVDSKPVTYRKVK